MQAADHPGNEEATVQVLESGPERPPPQASISPSRTPFSQTAASVYLDTIRGLAALAVCIGHCRALFLVDFGDIASRKGLLAPLYLLTSAGHQAVVVFFVLSGYLVGGSVVRTLRSGNWSWRSYLVHRLTRLWIVLIPALMIGGVLDYIGLHSHIAPLLYSGQVPNHVVSNVQASLNLPDFFGNVVFLETIFVHTFGSNGPLWSLANEFWYYMLLPFALLSLQPRNGLVIRLACAAGFILCAAIAGKGILLMFPIWLAGAALAYLKPPSSSIPIRWVLVALYTPTFFAVAKLVQLPDAVRDYGLGIATFALLYVLLGARSPARSGPFTASSRRMAAMSYSLYLVHFPFLLLLAALTVHDSRLQPTALNLGGLLVVFMLAIGFGRLFAGLTEFHTDGLRHRIEARLGPSNPATERPA